MGVGEPRRAGRRLHAAMLAVALAVAPGPAAAQGAGGGDGRALRVAVDVGHTLAAPGARSARGRGEFSFNLALADAVAQALRDRGVVVQVVNADGGIGSLQDRPAEAAAFGADLLLSIHHDSVGPQLLRTWEWAGRTEAYNDDYAGHSLFVSRDNPRVAESELCARVIGARLQRMGFVPTDKNANRPYSDPELAVHFYDGLAVLRHATMPAVLFEAGVIRNRAEELLLADAGYQARMADGIATAVVACLRSGRPAAEAAGGAR